MADLAPSSPTAISESISSVTYPIPIYLVSSRYFLYDIAHITDLRARHHVPGVLCGTLPSNPAQNLFLGLPLELMPEEVRLLVDSSLAYIVDDVTAHKTALQSLTSDRQKEIQIGYAKLGREQAHETLKLAEAKKMLTLTRLKGKQKGPYAPSKIIRASAVDESISPATSPDPVSVTPAMATEADAEDLHLFYATASTPSSKPDAFKTQHITPTTSSALVLAPTPGSANAPKPPTPSPRTHLYTYLHTHSAHYNLSPGLRFGCHFLVYPGDPLRFHSHFLANAYGWDEEIALGDLVGGGRLGTGVKKGFLVGGPVIAPGSSVEGEFDGGEGKTAKITSKVRCFCIEWGGM